MSKNTDIFSRVFVTDSKFAGWYNKTGVKCNRNIYTHEENANFTLKFGQKDGTLVWKLDDGSGSSFYALSNERTPPRVGDRTYGKTYFAFA